jgi:hypothetical protein
VIFDFQHLNDPEFLLKEDKKKMIKKPMARTIIGETKREGQRKTKRRTAHRYKKK